MLRRVPVAPLSRHPVFQNEKKKEKEMTQHKANFIALFQTWAITQFSSVVNGGFLAATAVDIAMNVDEEILVERVLRGKTAMSAVIDLGGFLIGDPKNNLIVLIDSPDAKRWREACEIFEYDAHDHARRQKEAV